MEKYKTLPQKLHMRYKNSKRKLEIASQMSKKSQNLDEGAPVNIELALVTSHKKIYHLKRNISKIWALYLVKLHV